MRFLLYFLFIIVFLFPFSLLTFGFEARTLVLTPDGHVPICEIHPGSYVVSQDAYGQLITSKVIAVSCQQVTEAMYLVSGNEILVLDEMQEVADHAWGCWKEGWQVPPGTLLTTKQGATTVQAAGDVQGQFELYDLALEKDHTFFVTKHNIQTHNFGIDLFLAASFATLLSSWSIDMVSVGIAVAGAVVSFFTDQYFRSSISLGISDIQAPLYTESGFGSHLSPDQYRHQVNERDRNNAYYAVQQRGYATGTSYQKTQSLYATPQKSPTIEIPHCTIEQRKDFHRDPTLIITHPTGSVEILEEVVCDALEKALDKELLCADEDKLDTIFSRFGVRIKTLLENSHTHFTETLAQKLYDHPRLPSEKQNIRDHIVKGAVEGATSALMNMYNNPIQTILSHAYAGPLCALHIAKAVGKTLSLGVVALVDKEKAQKEWTEYTKPLSRVYRFLQESDAVTLAHTASSLTVHIMVDGLLGSRLAAMHHKIIDKTLSICPRPVLVSAMSGGGHPGGPEKIISHGELPSSLNTTSKVASEYYKRFTPEVIEEAVKYVMKKNKFDHAFDPKHDFSSLQSQYTDEGFARSIIDELVRSEKLPQSGGFFRKPGIIICLKDKVKNIDHYIEARGFVSEDNIIKLGTCVTIKK